MADVRPNPDALLAQVQADHDQSQRGALKIYFGYAAGVGKTYAMLEHARRAKAAGRDVVLGYVEPHARPETQALTSGFEALPTRSIDYRGVVLREFDVDAAIARHPDLLLVDELAHTNAEGSRHAKRWQDVEELLEAGINVWTTLNVQHIETLNDVISQITSIAVRETIPDRVFDAADELELVDITPEELLTRLEAGKIYIPDQARRALQSFFQKANLTALRELSLRQTARRVHTEVELARRLKAVQRPWATVDRLLVCVGPSPTTSRVIRTAKRMAAALDAPWLAVSVDSTGETGSSSARNQIVQHFRLAERLGAETVTLAGHDVAATLLDFARSRNVTKILIGKTDLPRWRRLLWGSVVDRVLEQSGDIDVYVIRGEEEQQAPRLPQTRPTTDSKWPYLAAGLLVGLTGAITYAARVLQISDAEANAVMLFLAPVAWTAYRYGRGPALLASVLSVLVFDFCFVPPYFTFAVSDAQYVLTFAVMLAIGLGISTLTSRLKRQVESTRQRERRAAAQYELGKQLSSLYGSVFLVTAASQKIAELVDGESAIYLRGTGDLPELVTGHETSIAKSPVSVSAAQWVIEHDEMAGAGTNTLPNAAALFLPITGSQQTRGALAIRSADPARLLDPDQRRFLEACGHQLALALERDQMAIDAAEARIAAESEQARSSLLSSVSHDLRTPLAAIAGASSSLLESPALDDDTQRQLLETITEEAARLHRLLENILQMSKLEAGAANPNRQWHVLEEIVGSALERVRQEVSQHVVQVQLPANLPLVFVDGLLLEQVFVNLLENSARYTPLGTRVTISAEPGEREVRIRVADTGPGLPPGLEERVFDKFYRATPLADGGRGSGLGLAICRAILRAHGGSISARNAAGGGAEFVLRLPLPTEQPTIDVA
jgi:two-component system sensor histidine kinase KdpD